MAEFCRKCPVCQRFGKPDHKILVYPLKPLPVFESPFSRVLVDTVQPLPKTNQGHVYLLTIVDTASRYLAAVPLRNAFSKSYCT